MNFYGNMYLFILILSTLQAQISVLTIKSVGLSLHSGSALNGVREVLCM